jgi:uncharacterized membrane protein
LLENLLHKRDFYAGGIMTLMGAAVTLNSTTYNTGTLMHMGPGMFPFILGCVLTLIGVAILGSALVTPLGEDEHILPRNKEWLGWGLILAGPISFIIMGHFFGMAAATFSCVFISALGDRESTLKSSAVLALCITVPGCFLFTYVLQLPFPLFRWAI